MASTDRIADAEVRTAAATSRLDQWQTHLLQISAGSFSGVSETGFLGQELRAAAVIAAMAELEAVLREMLIAIGSHINDAQLPVMGLKASLRPLATHTTFESLISLRNNEEVWSRRALLTSLDSSGQIAQLPGRMTKSPQPPLDGRTIQPRHLATVHEVLGFPNFEVSARASTALIKLTHIRNDVAHANFPMKDVFSQAGRRAADIAQYLADLKSIIELLGDQWAAYVSSEGYRSSSVPNSGASRNRQHMDFEPSSGSI